MKQIIEKNNKMSKKMKKPTEKKNKMNKQRQKNQVKILERILQKKIKIIHEKILHNQEALL